MNNRTLLYIIIGILGVFIVGTIISIFIIGGSLTELKPELVGKASGTISVINDQPYVISNTKLFKIDNSELKLQKEFANDSQIELNPFGLYVTEKRPDIKTVYDLSSFQTIQKTNGRFFAWLSKDNYLITNSTDKTKGTDAGELTETAYRGSIANTQRDTLFTSQFITYMLLSDNTYIDLAQRDNEDNFNNITINQFTKLSGLQKITNKKNFGYKPFSTLGFSLIQENISSSPVYLIRDKQLTQLTITNNIQAIAAINSNTLIYLDKDTKQNTMFLYSYDISKQQSKPIAKLPVEFKQITSLAVNSQYIYLNSELGIYKMSIKDLI